MSQKEKNLGNQDEKEKARKLSKAEQKRLEEFEALSRSMQAEGFRRVELTISIVKANIFAVVLLIPLAILGFGGYAAKNGTSRLFLKPSELSVFGVALLALIVVHELIHGLSWSPFAKGHWKDIAFGFMMPYMTPYCACKSPLAKPQYIFGALMPMLLLGIVPLIAGILLGSFPVMLMGVIMTDAAAGDIMIVWKILRYRSEAKEVIYMDHPTQGGGVIFER